MKKILFMISLVIISQSCDPIRYCSFYIVNNCSEDINVDIRFSDSINEKDTMQHKEQRSYLMTHYQPLREEYVLHIKFDTIIIKKNGIGSYINYMDNKIWKFEAIDKLNWKATLIVNSEDFE